jgi:DNA-binding NtrC family response regulator
MERRFILTTLDHFEGDQKKAADVLKISLKTLYNRLNDTRPTHRNLHGALQA